MMRPKREPEQPLRELSQIDLEQLIDMSHPLVRLRACLDWPSFEQTLGNAINAVLSAAAIKSHKLLGACGRIFCAACRTSGKGSNS
jgi:hypothetical protein